MIKQLVTKIALYFHPPKNGDVFYADAMDYMCERPYERIHYPLIDRHGHTLWNFVPGNNTYRFTILSAAMPYYICDAEILVSNRENPYEKIWLKRSQQRRIWKKDFHRLIADGRMTKTTSQSMFN
jgi:hypothetical protein